MRPSAPRKLASAFKRYQLLESITPPKLECISTSALFTLASKVTMPLFPPVISSCPSAFRLPCSQMRRSAPDNSSLCFSKYRSKSVEADSSAPSMIKVTFTGKSFLPSRYFCKAVRRATICPLSSSTPRPYMTPSRTDKVKGSSVQG